MTAETVQTGLHPSFVRRGWPAWEATAKQILVGEMKRRKVTYKQLSRRLEAFGINEMPDQLNRKVNRCKFSAAFFLVCLSAMGAAGFEIPGLGPEKLDRNPCVEPGQDAPWRW